MNNTYRIGALASLFQRWGEDRYKKAAQLGFTHIDFTLTNTNEIYYTDRPEGERLLLQEKALMDKAGISVSQIHGPWRWPAQDSTVEDRAERLEKMKYSVRLAELLGSKYLVIHPIMPNNWDERISNPGHEQETWDLNFAFMRELLAEAKKHDIVVCLENMPMPNLALGSPEEILRFVKEMNDDHFKMCLDTGHAAVYPNASPADALRLCADEVRVLHIHDNNGRDDLHWMPYVGVVDWEDFGRALREVDFQGVFSFECSSVNELPAAVSESACRLLAEMARHIIDG